jgi:signal peptidase I
VLVKRVVAVAGDALQLCGDDLTLVATEGPEPVPLRDGGQCARSVVPQGMVYVVGDNRKNSTDSRDHGPIPERTLLGKALYLIDSRDDSRVGAAL